MNEKKQAIVLLSVVLAILAGIFLYRVQYLETKISDLMIEGDTRELHATVQTLQKYSYAKYGERIKNLLISSPPIVAAFAARDRQQLYEHTKIKYDSLKRENPYLHIMQFHLADGTVFLRMHRPASFGDRLGGGRAMVDAVHKGKAPLSGFDLCREGLFFRIVHPVFAQDKYVGAVEFGIEAREVIGAIEESLDEKIISYFVDDLQERAGISGNQSLVRVGRFIVEPKHAEYVHQLPPAFYQDARDHIFKDGARSFRVHNHQIFKNYRGDTLGGILFLQDVSAALQRRHAFFWKATLATLILFVVAAAVLYISFERILGSLVNEINERKHAETEVEDRGRQIRLLLDSTAEGIFGLDNEGRCTFVNRSCLNLLGYADEKELIGVVLHDLVHYRRVDGTPFPKEECPMCLSFHGGLEVNVDDEVLWRKDGHAIPVEYHAHPIKDGGRLLGSVVSFTDIRRRKQAEQDKERLAAAIEHAADEIIITNLSGVIEYVNPAFERVSGYSREEALGKNPKLMKSGKHSKEYYQELWQTIGRGEVWSNRIINKTKDGNLIEEDATISPIFDTSGRTIAYVAVKRDVTGKVRIEERLRQANKMESLGTLAGAIAHDFNNILNAIIGFTSLSLAEVPAHSKVAGNLHEVKTAAAAATDLVRQILAFSRKESSDLKAVAIQDVAKDVTNLLRCSMPKTISLDARLDMSCRPIWGNVSQIHQVIMNLGTNAYQALGKQGGEVRVVVREKTAENGAGSFVELTISDTGSGIAPEILPHIFEPYFTTKQEGQGTGLGLATVHDIVKKHQGEIEVRSEAGKGTTFILTLPVCAKHIDGGKCKGRDPVLPALGGHVLYVDDAAFNVMLGQEILQGAGCKVTGLSDSVKALELFRQRPDSFDLVVTDQMMPGLTGLDLARQLRQIRPEIPIIMVSGDEGPADEVELSLCGISEVLVKPIGVQDLPEAAARAMGQSLLAKASNC